MRTITQALCFSHAGNSQPTIPTGVKAWDEGGIL